MLIKPHNATSQNTVIFLRILYFHPITLLWYTLVTFSGFPRKIDTDSKHTHITPARKISTVLSHHIVAHGKQGGDKEPALKRTG